MGLFNTKDKIESEAEFDRLFEELGLEIEETDDVKKPNGEMAKPSGEVEQE